MDGNSFDRQVPRICGDPESLVRSFLVRLTLEELSFAHKCLELAKFSLVVSRSV
jgi:hypothetical protein